MATKQDKAWQYKASFALALFTLVAVLGYFVQSFIEIRKVKPVSVAIERIKTTGDRTAPETKSAPAAGQKKDGQK